jgi:hypothetical protein
MGGLSSLEMARYNSAASGLRGPQSISKTPPPNRLPPIHLRQQWTVSRILLNARACRLTFASRGTGAPHLILSGSGVLCLPRASGSCTVHKVLGPCYAREEPRQDACPYALRKLRLTRQPQAFAIRIAGAASCGRPSHRHALTRSHGRHRGLLMHAAKTGMV